jgi:hypothetical protein
MTAILPFVPFDEKFENIHIYARKIDVQQVTEVNVDFIHDTPYTGIWSTMYVDGLPLSKNLNGSILLVFRNQGEDLPGMALFLDGTFIVKAGIETESADTFCKLIQFLFDWINLYVDENAIKDNNGNKFIVPDLLYSKERFRFAFPK